MGKIKSKFITALSLIIFISANAQTETAAPPATAGTGGAIGANHILVACAIFLGFVIIGLASVLRSAISYHRHRKKSALTEAGKAALLLFISLSWWGIAVAQGADAEAAPIPTPRLSEADFFKWVMMIIIILEMITIFMFAKWIKYFTGIQEYEESLATAKAPVTKKKKKTSFIVFWERINKFKPIESEGQIDTGHSYDGIRELDNVTPPWFKFGLLMSFIFSCIYLWRYEVAGTGLNQLQEYEQEVAVAKAQQEAFLKNQASNVDETNVVMLDAAGIAAGSKLYTTNCVACHGDKGQGGVGPNLTDKYWLHGGSISDVFKSIKYGWPAQGMKAWKDDFSPVQMAQLASYVESLKNTNPPGAKEAQGEEYTETAATSGAATDSTVKKDGTDATVQ